MGMFSDDFTGCRYQKGQHVTPRDLAGNPHATIWEIVAVAKSHGGENYYACEAPGFGSIRLYESKIAVTDLPVSDFWRNREKPAPTRES